MKHIAKSLVVVGAMAAASSVSADVIADFNPYIGADYYQAWMKPKGDYNKILAKNFPGATLYVGTKFAEGFGLELGYDWSGNQKKSFDLPAGSTLFSGTTPGGVSGWTKVRRTGGHLDLVGFLPVAECFELTGSVGFGWVQPKITSTATATGGAAATGNVASAISSLSGKGRGVLRVGVGASYMVTDMVGLRAKLSWESSSSLRANGNQQFVALAFGQKPFKSTTALAAGAFVKF
jgi:hypothetical protein